MNGGKKSLEWLMLSFALKINEKSKWKSIQIVMIAQYGCLIEQETFCYGNRLYCLYQRDVGHGRKEVREQNIYIYMNLHTRVKLKWATHTSLCKTKQKSTLKPDIKPKASRLVYDGVLTKVTRPIWTTTVNVSLFFFYIENKEITYKV